MKRFLAPLALLALILPAAAISKDKAPAWSMNASMIEACSCPMFCQCYFNTKPAGHATAADASSGHEHAAKGSDHFCKFNNAFRVNSGSFGSTKLDGAKFWICGDLGGDFSKGEMDWAVRAHSTRTTTKEQRDGDRDDHLAASSR